MPYKKKFVKSLGELNMSTDMSKSLRPSQKKNQKTTMQNTVFKLIFSTCNPWTVSLHSLFPSAFRFTAVMAVSSNTESNSPK